MQEKKFIIGISGLARSGKDSIAESFEEKGFVRIALADRIKRMCKDTFRFSDEQLWGDKKELGDRRYPSKKMEKYSWCCHACTVSLHGEFFEEKTPGRILGPTLCSACLEVFSHEQEMHFVPVPTYLTPRHALQQLGTEWARSCHEDIWVDRLLEDTDTLFLGEHRDSQVTYTPQGGLSLHAGFVLAPVGVVVPDVRFINEARALKAKGAILIKVTRPLPPGHHSGVSASHSSESETKDIPESLFDLTYENKGTLQELHQWATKIATTILAQ